jgi:hypothetical protein
MSTSDPNTIVAQQTRVLQIIVAAQVAGLVFFLGIILLLNLQNKGKPPGPARASSILLPLVFVFATGALVMSVAVPRAFTAGARRQIAAGTWNPNPRGSAPAPAPEGKEMSDEAKLAVVYQSQKIVAVALIEGAAFFALIVYMLEGNALTLGLALLLIAAQVVHFPTREKVEGWIDQQAGLIRQERQLGA